MDLSLGDAVELGGKAVLFPHLVVVVDGLHGFVNIPHKTLLEKTEMIKAWPQDWDQRFYQKISRRTFLTFTFVIDVFNRDHIQNCVR